MENGNDIILLSPDLEIEKDGYINPTSNIITIPVPLTRAGIFLYEDPRYPNGIRRDYRPPEEVFDEVTMRTLTQGNLPMIRLHPEVGIVTSETFQGVDFIGSVGSDVNYAARELDDGSLETDGIINGKITLYDQQAIDEYKSGKMKSGSLGYTTFRIYEPGEINGVAYDAIQTKIRYNHFSGVPLGRFGIQDFDQRVQRLLDNPIAHDGCGFDDLGALVKMKTEPSQGSKKYIFTPMTTTKTPKGKSQEKEVSVDHLNGVIEGLRQQITGLETQITNLTQERDEAVQNATDTEATEAVLNDALELIQIATVAGVANEGENLAKTVVNDAAGLIGRVMAKVAPNFTHKNTEESLGFLSVSLDTGALALMVKDDTKESEVANDSVGKKPASEKSVDAAKDSETVTQPKAQNRYAAKRSAWLKA